MSDLLTADEVRTIRQGVTWADREYGKRTAGKGADEETIMLHSMHKRAQRLGLAGTEADEFADRISMDVLGEAVDYLQNPTPASGASSLPSVDSGG